MIRLNLTNSILTPAPTEYGINSLRLIINTTLGIFGIFDVAEYYGIQKLEKEDYGQTLGHWGVEEGCYIVLPVLGPSTVRDTIGSLANFVGGDAELWLANVISTDTVEATIA